MPIEVEDIAEPAPVTTAEESEPPVPQGSETLAPAPKKRGRPPGSKNRPKAAEAAPVPEAPEPKPKPKPKKVKVAPPPPPSESEEDESEEDEIEEPPSPGTQRKTQWAQYRQKQVDAYQTRVASYSNVLDKMLGF